MYGPTLESWPMFRPGRASMPRWVILCRCGLTFLSVRSNAESCSKRCRDSGWHQRRPPRWRAGTVAPYRSIVDQLRERDGDECQLCLGAEGPLKFSKHPSLTVRDPLVRSVDHVVPQSLGGGDELENLRLAHFVCNARRGNRMK